ncbi:nuclear-interacting partner of ALK [Acrasis kona]|uniref:Nuclear-interacting partner of ALK n=1 Tax=Acrasis kona TaxID=1008807 RepID=A0AAW2ZP47_9EUKA
MERVLDPISLEQFRYRVKTYSMLNWYSKPYSINPMVCSRYGFECVRKDVIECPECKASLKFNTTGGVMIEEEMASNIIKRMQSTLHEEKCIFYNNPSPLTFLFYECIERIPYSSDELEHYIQCRKLNLTLLTQVKKLVSRVTKLNLKHFITEPFDLRPIEQLTNQTTVQKKLTSCINNQDNSTTLQCLTACIYGWKVVPDKDQNQNFTLHCDHCTIKIPISSGNTLLHSLDPSNDHRHWCPCVKSASTYVQESNDFQRTINYQIPGFQFNLECLCFDDHDLSITEFLKSQLGFANPLDGYRKLKRINSGHGSLNHALPIRFSQAYTSNQQSSNNATTITTNINTTQQPSIDQSTNEKEQTQTNNFGQVTHQPQQNQVEPTNDKDSETTQSNQIPSQPPIESEKETTLATQTTVDPQTGMEPKSTDAPEQNSQLSSPVTKKSNQKPSPLINKSTRKNPNKRTAAVLSKSSHKGKKRRKQ